MQVNSRLRKRYSVGLGGELGFAGKQVGPVVHAGQTLPLTRVLCQDATKSTARTRRPVPN